MKAIVENDIITIESPTSDFEKHISKLLKYTDKAKQYQLRRMGNNPFLKSTAAYKKLQAELNGSLLSTLPDGNLQFSSGFSYLLKDLIIEDNRKETGTTVALPWVKKAHDLRDYQDEAVSLMEKNYRGIVNFATGLGKTLVAVHLVKRLRKRALIVCPSESIASQFYDELESAFGKHKMGFWGDGVKKLGDITVGIAASVSKDPAAFVNHDIGLVIVDEVHHVPANTFYNIAEGLGKVGRMFGLTATDFRSDGKDIMITGGCGDVLIRRDIRWGVEHKWLAAPYFIVKEVDTTGRKQYKTDKLKNYKEHVLNCDIMKNQIRSDAEKFMKAGKSVLILVDEVAHGKELSAQLGIPFATGKDKASQGYVDQLNAGKLPGLVGTDGKVGEGTDTRNVDVLILANFVASRGPVIQAIGRGLRKYKNKEFCMILDYIPMGSDMLSRHGYGRVDFYRDISDKVKVVCL